MAGILEKSLILEEDAQQDKFLIFSLGQEDYGVEIKYVREIIRIQTITQIPELPLYIKGVINLRGKIIPVMDIRIRFQKEVRQYDDRTCIIVVNIQDIALGLVVDRVCEVLTVPESDIAPPPQLNKESQHRYIKGIGKVGEKVKIIIDSDSLLDEGETRILEEMV